MSEKQTETMEEKRRIRRANIVLEEIDGILDSMIDSIVNPKNEIDGNSIGGTTFDANATKKFISKINSKSLEINGDEKMLIAINKRYDDAINMLKKAMKEEMTKNELQLFVLAITDILNSNSEIIALGDNAEDIIEKAFDKKLEENRAFLEGVVSRKKQLLPNIDKNI